MSGTDRGWLLPADRRAVRTLGDPVLRTPAAVVTRFDAHLPGLARRMFAVMRSAGGVGLAANQIGVSLAVFVLDCAGITAAVVNPVLVVEDPVLVEAVEGCLSVPGHSYPTPRPRTVTVTGFDPDGAPLRLHGTGLLARCLHHEVDHLTGRVYLDRLTGAVADRARIETTSRPSAAR